jgi:hypothetical protein
MKNQAWTVFIVLRSPKDGSLLPVSMCTVQETREAAVFCLLANPDVIKLLAEGHRVIMNQCHLIPANIAPMNREDV